jgi:hypothetical protein
MAINNIDFHKWYEEFNSSFKNHKQYTTFEYDFSTTHCELCRRRKDAKRLNRTYYDENRAVEYSTGNKTVLKVVILKKVENSFTMTYCICQSCIYRLLINQTDFIVLNQMSKFRFIKKNELANH